MHQASAHPQSPEVFVSTRILAGKYGITNGDHRYNQHSVLITMRGGQEEDYDDDYDDDVSSHDDDGESRDSVIPSRGYDHNLIDPPLGEDAKLSSRSRQQMDSSRSNPQERRPLPRRSRTAKKPSHWTQRMTSSSIKMTSQLAWGAVQQTGKVAYHLVKPRHVEVGELQGLWRLDQSIVTNGGGGDLASVATVELDPRKRVVRLKLPDGTTVEEPFTFEKTRLGSWKTEFVSPAFLVGDTPRLYGYRGTWQRKLADKRVIKLVGKIYTVRKQRFGKEKGKYIFAQPVGTFVARRRMKLSSEDDDDAEYESEEDFEGPDEEDDEGNSEGDVSDA